MPPRESSEVLLQADEGIASAQRQAAGYCPKEKDRLAAVLPEIDNNWASAPLWPFAAGNQAKNAEPVTNCGGAAGMGAWACAFINVSSR
jgi:hypothetical protein